MVPLRRSVTHTLSVIPVTLGLVAVQILPPLMTPTAQAQKVVQRILTVSGRGVEKIPTTLAKVNLGVEVRGKSAQQVQAAVARQSSSVMQLLKGRKVSALQTLGIRLNPTYDYSDNQQRLTGYVGTNTVSFKVANQAAGDILDDAVNAGATRINGISFTATDKAIAAAQKVALKKATQDAQSQAAAVLSALGFEAQEIVGIQVNNASAPTPVAYQTLARASSAPRRPSTPVVGGDQDVSGSVTLQIRY
ncbi:SIMPL domain-containing protein [filamentous cyanobacterium LEGE 11480]|uniref:SIMPL domain-containing protein n=1 Tax=Romeriopsis navalis LEGE 11480 TaxID=2777977 RepID=A0A928Z475_9CYAN|nr:SIMPL domain-containing protein [Romeriopsis navalis]MBE9032281.1 SIMPL domain-containing protein [Romeriopsis navalis LEGE 11480]